MDLPLDTIVLGDNVETLRTFEDDCIDLTVTSPPYDNLRTYSSGKSMDELWDFEGVASELWRVTKPGGVVVWVVADATVDGSETGTSFRQALRFMEIGFRLHDTMIYQRACPTWNETSRRYRHDFEFAFVLSSGQVKTFNPIRDVPVKNMQPRKIKRNRNGNSSYDDWTPKHENTVRGNIWHYANGSSQSEESCAFEHPAVFPEKLARDHILSWSNEGGDIVLDPFSGSGTTAKMAKHNGRRFIGIEVNPEYVDISNERLRQGVLF